MLSTEARPASGSGSLADCAFVVCLVGWLPQLASTCVSLVGWVADLRVAWTVACCREELSGKGVMQVCLVVSVLTRFWLQQFVVAVQIVMWNGMWAQTGTGAFCLLALRVRLLLVCASSLIQFPCSRFSVALFCVLQGEWLNAGYNASGELGRGNTTSPLCVATPLASHSRPPSLLLAHPCSRLWLPRDSAHVGPWGG